MDKVFFPRPLNRIKIDQSFVQDICKSDDDRAVVTAIIAMAHNFKCSVLAEGVETEEQYKELKGLKCDEIQGFYISEPMNRDEVLDTIAKSA